MDTWIYIELCTLARMEWEADRMANFAAMYGSMIPGEDGSFEAYQDEMATIELAQFWLIPDSDETPFFTWPVGSFEPEPIDFEVA